MSEASEEEESGDEESQSAEEENQDLDHPGDNDNAQAGQQSYSSCVTSVTHQRNFSAVTASSASTSTPLDQTLPGSAGSDLEHMESTDGVLLAPSNSTSSMAIMPSSSSSNVTPGAMAATEIFHHLQATRDKSEVTVELAKILSVLQTTLKEDSTSSSGSTADSDEDTSDDTDEDEEEGKQPAPVAKPPSPKQKHKQLQMQQQQPVLLGKPPKCPYPSRGLPGKIGPEIQQRIKELAAVRPDRRGKEEMSILSKILVTLLCSCKSTEATMELRKIIRHFRDAASEATDEVDEEIKPMMPSSRTSSRGSRRSSRRRRRSRSRRSSNNSNNSNSEAESLTNTLTPCNTDSKSSGTEDEMIPMTAAVRRRSSVPSVTTPTNEGSSPPKLNIQVQEQPEPIDPNVSFTVSLPRRPSMEVAEISASISPTKMMAAASSSSRSNPDNKSEEGEEWEWEEDDDAGTQSGHSPASSQRSKRLDSTSSRELSSAEGKYDQSSTDSTTRKLFTDMECGAYNSDSMYSPGHSGQSDVGASVSEQSQVNKYTICKRI